MSRAGGAPPAGPEPGAAVRHPALRRSVSLPLLVLYGLGTTVGAGIYALTGKIAGLAGAWTPAAFMVSCALAAFTALSFAELASRYPRSAAEAVYLRAGFDIPRLAQMGGLFMCLSAATSGATLALAVVGYVGDLVAIWQPGVLVALVLGLGLLAAWGIRESVAVAAFLTVLEVGGVLLVVGAGGLALGFGSTAPVVTGPPAGFPLVGVLSGAVLGFYAFLGFEDMVNVAEEVKRPRLNVPLGVMITLLSTGVLYLALSSVAVRIVAPADLSESEAPLTLVYASAGGPFPPLISAIAAVGMVNGILVQMIMGSRILYGLASQGAAPRVLGSVNARTQTPLYATLLVVGLMLAFVFWLPLESLARGTSWITMLLFALINWGLFRIKGRPEEPEPPVRVPRWVPFTGAFLCGSLLIRDLYGSLG